MLTEELSHLQRGLALMNKDLMTMDMALPLGSLEAYIYRANQIPMLTAEEEQSLAKKYIEDKDLDAARQMVLAHLRYVVSVARSYMGYGLALGDLIQEGNIGLMKAVKRFDPKVGVRLVSFAVHWIKAEIHEFVLRNWRIVKVATTKAQRKLFFNLRTMKKRLGWFSKDEVAMVANNLGVSTAEVLRMEQRLNATDMAFDAHDDMDDDETYKAPAHYLEDHSTNPALLISAENSAADDSHKLQQALACLDKRSQDILQQRWLVDKKATLHDLSAQYNVSAERIRQLEAAAMKKLREAMLAVA